jgi:hypothetical protein
MRVTRKKQLYPYKSSYRDADSFCVKNPSNCLSFLAHPFYQISYQFRVPGHAGLISEAEFFLDASGKLIADRDMMGIPDCVHEHRECTFEVTQFSAISIATGAGLEPGIDEWETDFHWMGGDSPSFVWTLSNTLSADQATGQSKGRTVVIDANLGSVLQIYDRLQTP